MTENEDLDAEMAHTIQSDWEKTGIAGTGCSVWSNNKFEGQGVSSPLYKMAVRQAMMYDAGTCAVKKARGEVGCGGNEDVKMDE